MRPDMRSLRTEYCEHKAKRKNGTEFRIGKTIFVALPMECWQPIQGGCGCTYCKDHPELIPHWDTMVIDATGKSRFTSLCHYPEFTNPSGRHWTGAALEPLVSGLEKLKANISQA